MCCGCQPKRSVDVLTRAKAKDPDALYFFQDKFRLVQMIATLQTPYVAVLDGYACKYTEGKPVDHRLLHVGHSGRRFGLVCTRTLSNRYRKDHFRYTRSQFGGLFEFWIQFLSIKIGRRDWSVFGIDRTQIRRDRRIVSISIGHSWGRHTHILCIVLQASRHTTFHLRD